MLDPQIENIFSHAVALDQSGRMKNTIYCSSQTIFILNNEGTIILRFVIPSHLAPFKNPVSFKADDYEPGNLQEKDGRVIFTKSGEEFSRSKSCKAPERTFSDIEKIWDRLQAKPHSTFTIHQKSLSLLDDGLSHLEISAEKGSLKIVQRDIFSGTVSTLTRENKGLGVMSQDNIKHDFGPVGVRTDDFMALYSFRDVIEFGVPEKSYFMFRNGNMQGFLANCIYDELGKTEEI